MTMDELFKKVCQERYDALKNATPAGGGLWVPRMGDAKAMTSEAIQAEMQKIIDQAIEAGFSIHY